MLIVIMQNGLPVPFSSSVAISPSKKAKLSLKKLREVQTEMKNKNAVELIGLKILPDLTLVKVNG